MGKKDKGVNSSTKGNGSNESDLKAGHHTPDGGVDTDREIQLQKLHTTIFGTQKKGTYKARSPLVAEEQVGDQPGFIVTVPNFFAQHECRQLCAAMEKVTLNEANNADKNPRKNEAYLDRESLTFRDQTIEDVIRTRLEPLMPQVEGYEFVGFSDRWRYYIYRRGQRFGQHVDVSTKGKNPREQTEYTLLVYLNGGQDGSDLEGGETIFWATAKKELCRVSPEAGTLLLHAHGRRCLLHEGAEVLKGAKYMLRTDVMYKKL